MNIERILDSKESGAVSPFPQGDVARIATLGEVAGSHPKDESIGGDSAETGPASARASKRGLFSLLARIGSIGLRGSVLSVLLAGRLFALRSENAKYSGRAKREAKLDDTIDQSFPASDPPAHY